MTPENAERALYSDILNLSIARKEYKQLSEVLGKITKTYQVKDLLTNILKDDAIKGECQGTTYDPVQIPDKIHVHEHTIGGFYFRIAQSLPIYEIASHYTGEVLLLHGDSDPIVNKIASERYHDVYKNSELHIVKGADHGFGPSMQPEATQAAVDFFCKED